MLKDIYKPTKYFEPYQPNPTGKTCGDCSIRCIAVAMDKTWEEAFDLLSAKAREMYYEMSEPAVVSEVLKENGFTEMKVSVVKGKKRPTMVELIKANHGRTIVGQVAHHWSASRDGKVRDLWNSSERPLYKYWVK